MIRPVARTEDGRTVYGFTIWGVALIAAFLGFIIAAAIFSYLAFGHANRATRDRIVATCNEANERHRTATPEVVALVRSGKPLPDRAEREAQNEALTTLEGGGPPPSQAGRVALHELEGFIQVLAPAYNCTARLRKLAP